MVPVRKLFCFLLFKFAPKVRCHSLLVTELTCVCVNRTVHLNSSFTFSDAARVNSMGEKNFTLKLEI